MTARVAQRVLVTGGAGYIGRHLVKRLVNDGAHVQVLSRSRGELPPGVEVLLGDVRNLEAVSRAVDGVDVVYHLAGRVHAFAEATFNHEQYEHSVGGALALTTALAGRRDVRLVFMSTVAVYGDGASEPHVESEEPQPGTAYGGAKLLAERMLLAWGKTSGAHVSCVRPAAVYGPRAPGNLDRLLRVTLAGLMPRLPRSGAGRAMVHVDDVVDACLLVAADGRANGEAFNVAEENLYTAADIVDAVLSERPRAWPTARLPLPLLTMAAQAGSVAEHATGRSLPLNPRTIDKLFGTFRVSATKLRQLGWQPRHDLWSALPSLIDAAVKN